MSANTALTSAVVTSIAGTLVSKMIWKDVGCSSKTADEGSFMPIFDHFYSTDRPFLLLLVL